MKIRGKAPTFTSDAQGYRRNPYPHYIDCDTESSARGNPRVMPLPYDLIHNVTSTISEDLTQYASEGSLQDEEYFIVDLTGERYADGSLIQDRTKLLVIVHLMTSENRERLENELGWPIYPQQGEFLIKDAGFLRGNLTDTNEPVYLLHLYLNGEVAVQDAQVSEGDLYHLLIHEWTHLRDRPFRRDREWSFEDPEDYYNMPHEVSAYLQQIVHDVTTHRQVYIEKFESKHNGIVEFLDVYSPEWREIEASLSRKNRKRVLNAVYMALYGSGD